MSDTQESKKPGWLNLTTFVLMCVGFAGGFVTNYSTRSAQLDQVIMQIADLAREFKGFTKDYNISHEENAIAIRALNQHLEYTDKRIADLERRQ